MRTWLSKDTSVTSVRFVLLQLEATPTSVATLEFTRDVALCHEATLRAMFTDSRDEEPTQRSSSEDPATLLQPTGRGDVDRTTSPLDVAPSEGGRLVDWSSSAADPVEAFCRHAPYADPVVLAQHDLSARSAGTVPANFVESAITDSGEPALILPLTGNYETPDRVVLIGWNATPQAARAVTAALPSLRIARRVQVMEFAGTAAPHRAGDLDIAHCLRLHGIESTLTLPVRRADDSSRSMPF